MFREIRVFQVFQEYFRFSRFVATLVQQTGRPPKRWTDDITDWTKLTRQEAVGLSQYRETRSKMAPMVAGQGTRRKGKAGPQK